MGWGRWDLASGTKIQPSISQQAGFSGERLTSDDSKILTWSTGAECDTSELECRRLHRREPISVAPVLQLWDIRSGEEIGPPITPDSVVRGALFMRDETQILSWSDDGLQLWDAATAKQIGDTMDEGEAVLGALVTRDETRVLAWSTDTLRLLDLKTGKQIGSAMQHRGDSTIWGVLTKDETRILSWDAVGDARLWDMATLQQIGPTMSHDDSVYDALFTADETHVLSWSGSRGMPGTLQMWDVFWHGRNLFEIACNYSPPDHELSGVSKRYGVKVDDPICAPGQVIPSPDWNSIQ
jgi:WD40 repeat protein